MLENDYVSVPCQVILRVIAFIYRDDQVLLIHREKPKAFAYGKWNGVGGHIEKGEDPLTAIRREVKEETGLSIQDFNLNAIAFISTEKITGICLFIFSAYCLNDDMKSSSEGEVRWIKRNDLQKINIVKDVPFLLDVISQSKKTEEVLILKYIYMEGNLNYQIVS